MCTTRKGNPPEATLEDEPARAFGILYVRSGRQSADIYRRPEARIPPNTSMTIMSRLTLVTDPEGRTTGVHLCRPKTETILKVTDFVFVKVAIPNIDTFPTRGAMVAWRPCLKLTQSHYTGPPKGTTPNRPVL